MRFLGPWFAIFWFSPLSAQGKLPSSVLTLAQKYGVPVSTDARTVDALLNLAETPPAGAQVEGNPRLEIYNHLLGWDDPTVTSKCLKALRPLEILNPEMRRVFLTTLKLTRQPKSVRDIFHHFWNSLQSRKHVRTFQSRTEAALLHALQSPTGRYGAHDLLESFAKEDGNYAKILRGGMVSAHLETTTEATQIALSLLPNPMLTELLSEVENNFERVSLHIGKAEHSLANSLHIYGLRPADVLRLRSEKEERELVSNYPKNKKRVVKFAIQQYRKIRHTTYLLEHLMKEVLHSRQIAEGKIWKEDEERITFLNHLSLRPQYRRGREALEEMATTYPMQPETWFALKRALHSKNEAIREFAVNLVLRIPDSPIPGTLRKKIYQILGSDLDVLQRAYLCADLMHRLG